MKSNAEIHDLGYARYDGARTPVSRRFWVIALNVVQLTWRRSLIQRAPIFFSLGTVLVCGVVMYFMRYKFGAQMRLFGNMMPREDGITVMGLEFLRLMAFVLGLSVACSTIADDLRLGSFQFYFSRAIRRRDYILGKVLGAGMVIGVPLLLCPILLSVVRLLFSEDLGEVIGKLHLIARAAAFGLVATAAFTLIPLGLGALFGKRRIAQVVWVLLYVVVGFMSEGLSMELNIPELALGSLGKDLRMLAAWIYDVPVFMSYPGWLTLPVLLGSALLALLILRYRVRALETANIGGS